MTPTHRLSKGRARRSRVSIRRRALIREQARGMPEHVLITALLFAGPRLIHVVHPTGAGNVLATAREVRRAASRELRGGGFARELGGRELPQ